MALLNSAKEKATKPIDVSSEFDTTSAQVTIIAKEVIKCGNIMQGYFRFTMPSSTSTNNPTICTFPSKYNPVNPRGVQGVAQNTWNVNRTCGFSLASGLINVAAQSYEASASYVFTTTWIIED